MPYKPQRERKHPDEWGQDLNPDRMAGQNIGPGSADQEMGLRTAYDVKDAHRSLRQFSDDDLRRIPVLPDGQRLQQGGTYIDLGDPDRLEFTATGEMRAEGGSWIVPKDNVPYPLWNRLIGEDEPERR